MENNMNRPAILFNNQGIVVVMNGRHYTAQKGSHPNYDVIFEAIKAEDWNALPDLLDVATSVAKYTDGLVSIQDGVLYYNGSEMHSALTTRILQMFQEGLPIKHMTAFLRNLMDNPSKTAVDELYLFLEACSLPITEDGCFLAYKKVRNNYKDIHSGKFDNSVGAKPEMKRNEVDDNRNNTCSRGLHFCSIEYLPYFSSASNDRVMIVKINPANVVSIPSDYNNSKGRAWTYEVIAEYNDYKPSVEAFDRSVYTNKDLKNEYDYGDDFDDVDDMDDYDPFDDSVFDDLDEDQDDVVVTDDVIESVTFYMDDNSEIVRAEVTRSDGSVEMYYEDDEFEELHHELRFQASESAKARVKVVNV
jgi:hypothetical protein